MKIKKLYLLPALILAIIITVFSSHTAPASAGCVGIQCPTSTPTATITEPPDPTHTETPTPTLTAPPQYTFTPTATLTPAQTLTMTPTPEPSLTPTCVPPCLTCTPAPTYTPYPTYTPEPATVTPTLTARVRVVDLYCPFMIVAPCGWPADCR
jgi:hypothetical protein